MHVKFFLILYCVDDYFYWFSTKYIPDPFSNDLRIHERKEESLIKIIILYHLLYLLGVHCVERHGLISV
jgi:hypothetical protein